MKNRIVLNTFIPLVLQITTIISGFIIPRLILSHFGSQINGLVNSITQFLSIISFMEMGVGSVVRYNLYSPLVDSDTYKLSCVYSSARKYFRLIAKILFCYVIVLVILYPLLVDSQVTSLYSAGLIVVLSITFFAQYYFGQVNQILLVADQKSYISSSIQIAAVIFNTLLSVFLINIGASIHIVKLVAAFVFAAKPVVLSIYVKRHYDIDENIKYDREPISQKWNGMAQHIAAVVLDQTDILVLTSFSTLINVSIYSTYHLVINGVKMMMLSMTNGIEAYIGSLIAKNEMEKLEKTFDITEWIIHTFTTFVFSCTMVLIVPFVLVYTRGISDADYSVPLFSFLITIANAGHCLRLPYSILILAAGHYKQTQHNYIISAILNIIISIMLVRKSGLIGVAIGTITAMIYQTIWMAWYTSQNIVKRTLRGFLKQLFVDASSAVLIVCISKSFIIGSLTYNSWILLSIRCVVLAIVVIGVINILLYRRKVVNVVENLLIKKLRGKREREHWHC